MGLFADRVQTYVASAPGTGSVQIGAAVSGYRSFAQAGITDGQVVAYVLNDGTANWEIGKGTYSSSGPLLARTTILSSSNSNAAINASQYATVSISFITDEMVTFTGLKTLDVGYSFGWSDMSFRHTVPSSFMIYDDVGKYPLIDFDGAASDTILSVVNSALKQLFGVSDASDVIVRLVDGDGLQRLLVTNDGATYQSGGITLPVRYATTAITATESDFLIYCPSGTFTVTLGVLPYGRVLVVKNAGAGTITVSGSIDGQPTTTVSASSALRVVSIGSSYTAI